MQTITGTGSFHPKTVDCRPQCENCREHFNSHELNRVKHCKECHEADYAEFLACRIISHFVDGYGNWEGGYNKLVEMIRKYTEGE